MIVEFTEVNNILLQWLCFFSLRSQTCGKKPKPKGFLTVLFPINVRSRSLMIWPLLQFKSGWFYFYVLIPWSIRITYLICQAFNSIESPNQEIWQFVFVWQLLVAAGLPSLGQTKQFPGFLMISWNKNGLEEIPAKTITTKWLDSKSFEAHWKWKCFVFFPNMK